MRHLRCRVPERCDQRGNNSLHGTTARARSRAVFVSGYTPGFAAFKISSERDAMREYFSGGIMMTVTDGCFRPVDGFDGAGRFLPSAARGRCVRPWVRLRRVGPAAPADHPACARTGIEILPDAAAQARKNIDANHLSEHFSVITGDLRGHRTLFARKRLRRRRVQPALLSPPRPERSRQTMQEPSPAARSAAP